MLLADGWVLLSLLCCAFVGVYSSFYNLIRSIENITSTLIYVSFFRVAFVFRHHNLAAAMSLVGTDARLCDRYQQAIKDAEQKVADAKARRSCRSSAKTVASLEQDLARLRAVGISGYRNFINHGSYEPPGTQDLASDDDAPNVRTPPKRRGKRDRVLEHDAPSADDDSAAPVAQKPRAKKRGAKKSSGNNAAGKVSTVRGGLFVCSTFIPSSCNRLPVSFGPLSN